MNYLEVFRNKKVFITGHTGFKGSWLVRILASYGAEIYGYSLQPITNPNLFTELRIEKLCRRSLIADIRDRERMGYELKNSDCDYVFHLAAQPIVRTSYEMPCETFDTNLMGTTNLLDAIRKYGKKGMIGVFITTDKVYNNIEKEYSYKEDDPLGGYDPYSASKACCELAIDSYRRSFFNPKDFETHGIKIISLRAGNVIGGGDWAKDRLIPDIARALSYKKEIIIRNPDSTRPWQHVFEPLSAYLYFAYLLNEKDRFISSLNIGPRENDNIKVEDMVKMSLDIWKEGSYKVEKLNNQPHEAGLLSLNIEKAESLGWRPKWDAKTALEKTLSWYNEFYTNSNNIESFSLKQIEDFFSNNN